MVSNWETVFVLLALGALLNGSIRYSGACLSSPSSGNSTVGRNFSTTTITTTRMGPTTAALSFGHCGHTQFLNNGEGPSGNTTSSGSFGGIVNGAPAQQNEFPWQAVVSIHNSTVGASYLCGGSLISSTWVVTAAHCCSAASSARSITVKLGSILLTDNFIVRATATRVVIHPSYNSITQDNDICLLQIPVVSLNSWTVQPICLPLSCEATCQPGEYAIITGWGLTSSSGSISTILRKGAVPIQPRANCLAKYPALTDNMECAGFPTGGTDACQGDSGGPLACLKRGTYYMDAVTSHGYGCGQAGSPGVYSRLCTVIGWIASVTVSS